MPSLRISTGDTEIQRALMVQGKNHAALGKLDAVMASLNKRDIPGSDSRRKWIGIDWKKEPNYWDIVTAPQVRRDLQLSHGQMSQLLAESCAILDIDDIFKEWTSLGWTSAKKKQAIVDMYFRHLRERWGRAFNIPPHSRRFKQLMYSVAKVALAQVKKDRQKLPTHPSRSDRLSIDSRSAVPKPHNDSNTLEGTTCTEVSKVSSEDVNSNLKSLSQPDTEISSHSMASSPTSPSSVIQSEPQKSNASRVPSDASAHTQISTTPPGSPNIQLLTTDYPSTVSKDGNLDSALEMIYELGSRLEVAGANDINTQTQFDFPTLSPGIPGHTEDAMMMHFFDGTKDLLLHPSELSSIKYKGRYTVNDIEIDLLNEKITTFFGLETFQLYLHLPDQPLDGTSVSEAWAIAELARYAFGRSPGAVMFRVEGNRKEGDIQQ
jgi:hypothetical protein